ncbi:MAG: exonuclease SbcCD subunit D [Treponema sp.]
MKFLQTGDWHLGKVFFEESLIEGQKYFIQQVIDELCAQKEAGKPYDALVIPGDIYDRAVPPAVAVTAFGAFLSRLHVEFPELKTLLLSGNHDSPERLAFAKEILNSANIHICTDCRNITEPVVIKNAAFYQLPYLTAGCVSRGGELFSEPLRAQQDLLDEAVRQIEAAHKARHADLDAVLCAHLFTAGAIRSDSERGAVGNAEQVSADSFRFFTYAALGHVHKMQKAGKNAYYSGSPLAYSFDESGMQKVMLRVEIENGAFTVEKIALHPLRRCTVITDAFDTIYGTDAYDDCKNDYIQVVCTDKTAIANPMNILRSKFPFVLSFTYETSDYSKSAGAQNTERRELLASANVQPEEIFASFLKSVYGKEAVAEDKDFEAEIKLFAEFARDAEKEEP